jgi:hypothetical protein
MFVKLNEIPSNHLMCGRTCAPLMQNEGKGKWIHIDEEGNSCQESFQSRRMIQQRDMKRWESQDID